ncbi:tachylectin-related carbohydrate-binding protein [Amycolatopsis sp. NPDC054798]
MPSTLRRKITGGGLAALTAAALLAAGPANAVTGGRVPDGDHRYAARVTIGERSCSGVLIHPQWVVTASTCFADTPGQGFHIPAGPPKKHSSVLVGRTMPTGTDGQTADIVDLVPRDDRDVVLAKLSKPIPGVAPIPLSKLAPVPGAGILTVAGYGRTHDEWVPYELHVTWPTVTAVTATTFELGGRTTCKGDAGGPAFWGQGANAALVGINSTSWQNGCLGETETRDSATEARIDNIGDWIRAAIPDLAIACKPTAPIFTVRPDGGLWLLEHTAARDGLRSWANGGYARGIGSGWNVGKPVAGPDGILYLANRNGELARFRWNGNGWDHAPGQTADGVVIDHGWERYAGAEYRDRLTVDATGALYGVEPDGKLHRRTYDPATKAWTHQEIGTGWDKYNLIVAAGDGVLYARTPSGDLLRGVYDAAANSWSEQPVRIGTGWHIFKHLTSAGADTLYGSYAGEEGGLLWYRYLPYSRGWVPSGRTNGSLVGQGFYSLNDITATSNSCAIVR